MKAQASILINRPREQVFDCITSMPFLQQWVAPYHNDVFTWSLDNGLSYVSKRSYTPEIHQVSYGKIGPGTTFQQSNESKGHPAEGLIEVTQYRVPQIFATRVTTETGRAETEWMLHSIPEGTRLDLTFHDRLRGTWTRFVVLIALLIAKKMITKKPQPGSPQYMQDIKEYIEQQC